jgi:hypothetical protein
MEDTLSIREAAIMTGLHRNTIRNYVKAGRLKATLIQEGKGKDRYVISRADLYTCGIPNIMAHLGTLEVESRLTQAQAEKSAGADTYAEVMRLNRELLAAREELAGLRVQVPMLQAAQVERDALAAKLDVLEVALDQARADMRWSARRRMSKAGKVQSG